MNLLLLVWRLLAVGQAFLDTRRAGPTGRLGIVGIALIIVLVVVPHVMAYRYGTAFGEHVRRDVRAPGSPHGPDAATRPGPRTASGSTCYWSAWTPRKRPATLDRHDDGRLARPGRATRVTMVSMPRDLIDVPLGNGDVFGPKLNSLMSYADRHPDEFPDGGMAALEDAVGALLGIDDPVLRPLRVRGFIADGRCGRRRGCRRGAGLRGPDVRRLRPGGTRLSRSRPAGTISTVECARVLPIAQGGRRKRLHAGARQQQVIVALRDAVDKDGSLLWELPALLDASARPSARTCRRRASRSSRRSWTRSRTRSIDPRRSSGIRSSVRAALATGRRSSPDLAAIRARPPSSSRSPGGAEAVADAEAERDAQGEAALGRPGAPERRRRSSDAPIGRRRRPCLEAREQFVEVGRPVSSQRWSGATNPSSTARSSHASSGSQ